MRKQLFIYAYTFGIEAKMRWAPVYSGHAFLRSVCDNRRESAWTTYARLPLRQYSPVVSFVTDSFWRAAWQNAWKASGMGLKESPTNWRSRTLSVKWGNLSHASSHVTVLVQRQNAFCIVCIDRNSFAAFLRSSREYSFFATFAKHSNWNDCGKLWMVAKYCCINSGFEINPFLDSLPSFLPHWLNEDSLSKSVVFLSFRHVLQEWLYDADMFNENSQYTIEWVIINIYYPTEWHTIQKVSAS